MDREGERGFTQSAPIPTGPVAETFASGKQGGQGPDSEPNKYRKVLHKVKRNREPCKPTRKKLVSYGQRGVKGERSVTRKRVNRNVGGGVGREKGQAHEGSRKREGFRKMLKGPERDRGATSHGEKREWVPQRLLDISQGVARNGEENLALDFYARGEKRGRLWMRSEAYLSQKSTWGTLHTKTSDQPSKKLKTK